METRQLIEGYTAYSSAFELDTTSHESAPAITPITSVTASSPECIAFTIGAAGGATTTTLAAGC